MLVASDTSPISNLAIIGRLNLLRIQFREIWIPRAVQTELDQLAHAAAVKEIQQALREGWIKARVLRDDTVARLLKVTLDPGEAETIALGLELSAELILLDERDGRGAAERAGLHVTGVLGVLLEAKRTGTIRMLKPEIEILRTKARFFISAHLEQEVLRNARE